MRPLPARHADMPRFPRAFLACALAAVGCGAGERTGERAGEHDGERTAAAAAEQSAEPANTSAARPMVLLPVDDIAYQPLDPAQPTGPGIAVLQGDPATGPSAMLLRTGSGGGVPHYHTADYHLLLVRGQMKHWVTGERESDAAVLEAGSYWFQPGNAVHSDLCVSDECVMFIVWSGPRDAIGADRP